MKMSSGDNSSSPPPPEGLQIDRIVELVRHICVTGSNLNLYSFKHAVSRKNLEDTLQNLTGLLRGRERITLNISKDTLLFEGFPIEERNPEEISNAFGRRTAPEGIKIYNPAFDVTPAELVTAIVTEKGVLTAPYTPAIAALSR